MFDSLMAAAQDQSTGASALETLLYMAIVVGTWFILQKMGQPGWASLIPVYREYKICEKTMGNGSYAFRVLFFFVPVIGGVLYLYYMYQIYKSLARSFAQPEGWAWGYLFLTPVFLCITAFGSYDYYGPYGEYDTRTNDARGARTVDFDVIRNEPAPDVKPVDVKPAEAEEVEFEFNQSDHME